MVTQEILAFFFAFLQKKSGLVLDTSKTYLIETRLEPIAVQEGFSSIEDLGRHMKANPSSPLGRKIVDAMATNETSFFRDITPFEVMKKVVLPNLIRDNAKTRRISIWCAACSTGQEPYSLAMLLCEAFSNTPNWDLRVIGTDLVEWVLGRAREGIYSQHEVQRGLPISYLTRFFDQRGAEWEIKPEVKNRVEFRHLNILSNFASMGTFDVIFCRNMLIYFDINMKKRVLERMAGCLSENGVIFLGGAETPIGVTDKFVRVEVDKGVYYKKNSVSK